MAFKGDDIYVPAQSSYEIQRMIDGSIPTIYDAPWPGFTPDLLSILVELKLQKSLTEFCHANQFSKIEDFVESFRAFQDGADDSEKQDSPDEFGLCWV